MNIINCGSRLRIHPRPDAESPDLPPLDFAARDRPWRLPRTEAVAPGKKRSKRRRWSAAARARAPLANQRAASPYSAGSRHKNLFSILPLSSTPERFFPFNYPSVHSGRRDIAPFLQSADARVENSLALSLGGPLIYSNDAAQHGPRGYTAQGLSCE